MLTGKKRKERPELDDVGPPAVVRVQYEGIPRESQKRLDTVLREWSQWHSERYPPGADLPGELTAGCVSYEPALLQLAPGLAVLEDKPAAPEKAASQTVWYNINYEKLGDVPAYDRAIDVPLPCPDPKRQRRAHRLKLLSHELALRLEAPRADGQAPATVAAEGGGAGRPVRRAARAGANRCFNCGSYAHSMRECWREYNRELAEQSKKVFADARGEAAAGRGGAKRYFLAAGTAANGRRGGGSGGGQAGLPLDVEFEDVRPGQLSEELRSAMGLGPLDPPPWLSRMKAMGPPPGYRMRTKRRRQSLDGGPTPVEAAAAAATAAALASAMKGQNGSVADANGGLHAGGFQHEQQQPHREGEGLANGAGPGSEPALERQASLESGEWEEGAAGGSLGDFLAFESANASAGVEGPPSPAREPSPPPAEDFIPVEASSSDASESEGEECGGAGGPEWEEHWVYAAQFPGVNAPVPEGADMSKWGRQEAERAGQGPSAAQRAQRQHGTSQQRDGPGRRFEQLQGLHTAGGGGGAMSPLPAHQRPSPGHGGPTPPLPDHQPPPPQQQHWQQQEPPRLLHMPSAPAVLQGQQHASAAGELQYSPYQGGQQAQQYSPIMQGPMLSRHASLAPFAGPPQQQQQQQQHLGYGGGGGQLYLQLSAPPGQVFGVSATDPGHLLAAMQHLQPQYQPPQQQQQQQQQPPPMFAAQQQQQQQQQPHAPMFAVQQQHAQPMFAMQSPQQQQQLMGAIEGGVVEAYNPECPAGQGYQGNMYALQLQPPAQQQLQASLPPGLYGSW